MRTIKMSKIKEIYGSGEGRHWFDKSAMRFFRSGLSTYGYQGEGGTFFVSSEKFDDNHERMYTVRQLVGPGEIDTIGEFHSLGQLEARKIAKQCAEGLQVINSK